MTVYSINHGIGWASSGVEYAQAYRSHIFRRCQIPAKFIFTDFFAQDNLADLTSHMGFLEEEIIWLYGFFTDIPVTKTTFCLTDLEALFHGNLTRKEVSDGQVRFFYEAEEVFLTAYLQKGSHHLVHRVEYVSRGNLVRKDYFSTTRYLTEYYTPRDNRAYLYQRRFFNLDGSVAYDEIIDGEESLFQFPNRICYSKEELLVYFMEKLALTAEDLVILDRATGTGQAVFAQCKPAKLAILIHAEHFSEAATTDQTILWNNYYDYQFTNAHHVDAFIVATDRQKELLEAHFATYTPHRPRVVTIPVGSIDQLRYPSEERRPFSVITASRLATEKHIDWLIKAVVVAKQSVPDLTFDIYGSGGEEDKLKSLIHQQEATAYIHLCGHQDLTAIYQTYELYLSASKSEGFGLTLLEAIGAGLPLIGFDVRYGNQTFLVNGQNGHQIPLPDPEDESVIVTALARAIVTVFQSGQLKQMQEASYHIAETFLTTSVEADWRTFVEDMR